jgi:hypothetical protein
MINQKNTFVSLAEQLALLNKNSIEVISKLNDVVTNRNSVVNVTMMNSDGTSSTYQFPTVGQLKNEIDIANRNIKKLAGLADSTAYVSDGTTMRRVYVDDLNREPEPIDSLNTVTRFMSINNSFFEALSNPMLVVLINLTDKIDRKVGKVLSRRYIIDFQKDENGNYTSDGQSSKKDFETKFLNRNDIFIDDLTTWYDNPKNYGLFKSVEPYDEQIFDLDFDQLEFYGVFDVIGVDNDTINKKMWYVLGSIVYYDFSGGTHQLSIGDELIINKKDSSTKWRIREVSTSKANFRINLERIEGLEPVPIISQGLKIYSPELSNKSIKVSIGYDEYNVIFIKPINTDANIVSSTWSYGSCFYSNDLVLDTNETVSMTKYYSESVFDYGSILKDMIVKNVPSKFGVTPNKAVLDSNNFKVVQINKHLTESANSTKIKELHSQKTSVKSQLEQLGDAITEKTREVSTKQFKSGSDKQASQNQLNSLINQQNSQTKLYTSIVNRISSENNGTTSVETPKFRIRGFWSFPEPQLTGYAGYQQKQEVVQFKVQYRYSAKGGSEPTTEGFKLNMNQTFYNTATSTGDISDQTKAYLNPSVSTKNVNVTGYFSNWNQFLSDARKRTYNKSLDVWTWAIEDVSDANTPNINQLDIPIQQNEKVEIRIKSISEVGWPNAPLESDWCEILTVEFPSDLSQVGGENSLILREAQNEEIYSQLESKFNAKGLTAHLQQSYYVNDLYVAHTDVNLGTSFKDAQGNIIMLGAYLKALTDKISALEELVFRAKGELVVKIVKDSTEVLIANGAAINITVRCEDYAELVSGTTRTYYNKIYSTDDYYLQFENIAAGSQLGLFSYRTYVPTVPNDNRFYNTTYSKGSLACYVNAEDALNAQQDNQFIWISDTSGVQQIYCSGTTYTANGLGQTLYSKNWNIGLSGWTTGMTTTNSEGLYAEPKNIFTDVSWSGVTIPIGNDYQQDSPFPVTVHPYIENIENYIYSEKDGVKLINAGTQFTLPIKIFFMLSGGSMNSDVTFPSTISTSPYVYRKLRIFMEPENLNRTFEFEVIFKIFKNRTYATRSFGNTSTNSVVPKILD